MITSTRVTPALQMTENDSIIPSPLDSPFGRTGIALTVLWVSCFFAAPVHAQQYSLIPLGTPTGSNSSYGTGINNSGQVSGYTQTAGLAFLYANGSFQNLGTLGGPFANALAVNASGQVTGSSSPTSGNAHAFLYTNGVMQDLGTLGGSVSQGNAINDAGQVTGYFSNLSSGATHAFLYSNGTMYDIGTLGGAYSYGTGINASGQITGSSSLTPAPTSPAEAFIYSNGTMKALGTLGGSYSDGNAINASGEVTGYSSNSSGVADAFLYSNGAMRDLGNLGGPTAASDGLAINDIGEVVGFAQIDAPQDQAFLYVNGRMLNLNSLDTSSPLAAYVNLTSATAINDSGWIVANGFDSQNGENEAFLLKPLSVSTPEPATVWLMLAGIATLGGLKRRERCRRGCA